MWHADVHNFNVTQMYGGRCGKIKHDAMIIIQLSSAISRLNRTNMVVEFNDTDGWYDHMQP